MSVLTTATGLVHSFLAIPVDSGPEPLPGTAQTAINSLWGIMLTVGAIVACLAGAGICMMLWSSRGGGGQNEHLGKLGWVFAGAIGMTMIAGVIGTITGV